VSSKVTLVKALQFSKAYLPIFLVFFGILIVVSDSHPEKAEKPIEVSEGSSQPHIECDRFLQLL
jgi:hypothetical protein